MHLAAPRAAGRHRKSSGMRHFLAFRPGDHTTEPAGGMHTFRKGQMTLLLSTRHSERFPEATK